MTIYELISKAESLRDETALNSVTPERIGEIAVETLNILNEYLAQNGGLGVQKIYSSVSAMQADKSPASDLTKKSLRRGQLVVIAPLEQTDSTAGDIYRYDGLSENKSVWAYITKIGGVPADSSLSATSVNPIQNKVVTEKLTELSEEFGIYNRVYDRNTTIFTKESVKAGSVIDVSFVTGGSGNGNILVKNSSGTIIYGFRIEGGESGAVYQEEGYILPNDYEYLAVGSYGKIDVNILVKGLTPKDVNERIDGVVDSIDTNIKALEDKLHDIQDEVTIYGQGDNASLEPTSIDKGKFLYVDGASIGKEGASSIQNIANFDVRGLDNNSLTILAEVSSNSLIGYQFILQDGTFQYGSLYENAGRVAEHNVIVPKAAVTLRFSYFTSGGISVTYKGNVSIKDYILTNSSASEIALSLAGADAIKASAATLTNDILTIEDVPTYTKKDCVLSFKADVASFNGISFGLGYETVRGMQIFIDSTNVIYKRSNQEAFKEAHGLTIGTFLRCSVYHELTKYVFVISTISGTYYKEFTEPTFYASETYGVPYLYADGSTTLNNVVISRGGSDFKKPVWIFGDSYLSFQEKRWIYYILTYGFKNYMLCGLAGASSAQMYEQFENCLKFGTPKYVVWCLGMNDGTSATPYKTYYEKVRTLCESKGIELILQTIPNVPDLDKSAINDIIKSSGLRFIDAADAVGSYENANWYNGFLDDGVHPSELGAKAIASQVLADFPEIMQY